MVRYSSIPVLFALLAQAPGAENKGPDPYWRQAIEHVRFQYDMLGMREQAPDRLREILEHIEDPSLKTLAGLYLARIFDQSGHTDSAILYYKQALKNLAPGERDLELIYQRLASLNPDFIQTISVHNSGIKRLDRVFPFRTSGRQEYILQAGKNSSRLLDFRKTFILLNARGELSELKLSLDSRETMLDACSEYYLSAAPAYAALTSYPSEIQSKVVTDEAVVEGYIMDCSNEEFILVFNDRAEFYHGNMLLKTFPFEGLCTWHRLPQNLALAVTSCADSLVFLNNIKAGSRTQLRSTPGKPFFITSWEHLLAIQYADVFQVRTGDDFQNVLWKENASLSDKIYLTPSGLYTLDEIGNLSRYDALSGNRIWQKPLKARELYPLKSGLCLLTYYHACLGVDLSGNQNWSYEFGWGTESSPFPLNDYFIFLYPDGQLVTLNTDLMKIYSQNNLKHLGQMADNFNPAECGPGLHTADSLIRLEPGNGMAWKYRYKCLELSGAPLSDQIHALTRAAQSYLVPPLEFSDLLQTLNRTLNSDWMWKRAYGPKFFPDLVAFENKLLYIENNNQTLVLLDMNSGTLLDKIHVPEELDSKICSWNGRYAAVSSPNRIYFIPVMKGSAGAKSLSIAAPVCESYLTDEDLIITDWYGNLKKIQAGPNLSPRIVWEKKLSESGLLICRPAWSRQLDVIDIQGKYFSIDLETGRILASTDLPEGTVTDVHSGPGLAYAGYDNGRLICLEKSSKSVRWTRKFPDQIFSLGGDGAGRLIISTAAKKIICLDAETGNIRSEAIINTSLVNKPVILNDGYWVGTTEPALEKRDFQHNVIARFRLTGTPGNPVLSGKRIFVSTLDGFVNAFKIPQHP